MGSNIEDIKRIQLHIGLNIDHFMMWLSRRDNKFYLILKKEIRSQNRISKEALKIRNDDPRYKDRIKIADWVLVYAKLTTREQHQFIGYVEEYLNRDKPATKGSITPPYNVEGALEEEMNRTIGERAERE